MKHWNKICGLLSIFLFAALFSAAQTDKSISYLTSLSSKSKPLARTNSLLFFQLKDNVEATSSIKLINQDYCTQHFGFFCKKELALEKTIKVSLHIRLGSLQQCNYLERKKNP